MLRKSNMDRLTPERRSWLMSRVASKNSSAEIHVRQMAHAFGLRFRLHRKDLPGTPDLVFPRHRIALFVHGCFWHRHPGCKRASTPKSNIDFWQKKFERNTSRDLAAMLELKRLGWHPVVIWECETKDHETLASLLEKFFSGDMIPSQKQIYNDN